MIPVNEPALAGRELEYVTECIQTGWVSSSGRFIGEFESGWAAYCGRRHGVAVSNGSTALQVAVAALELGPGDEVILPTFTIVSCVTAVLAAGGVPMLVDSDPEFWTMDVTKLESHLTSRTRAVMPVHIYGHPVDMGPVLDFAERHGLAVIEDAAEAHGAEYQLGHEGSSPVWRRCGSFGELSCFSFYANKLVTTGEGGMVVTDDDELAQRCRLLRGQGQDPAKTYWFPVVGFNYRLTNLQCAIGLAQLEGLDARLARRREIAARYRGNLGDVPGLALQREREDGESAHWMVGVVLPVSGEAERDRVAAGLRADGIETRPFFYPVHTLPPYEGEAEPLPVATDVAARGLCLPTWNGLSDEDVDYVSERLVARLDEPSA
jgi:perosamine synthetase